MHNMHSGGDKGMTSSSNIGSSLTSNNQAVEPNAPAANWCAFKLGATKGKG